MCWRGIVPSCTIATGDTYFSHANLLPFLLVGAGMVRHYKCQIVSHCPVTPLNDTFVGHLGCRHKFTTNFIFATEVGPGFQVSPCENCSHDVAVILCTSLPPPPIVHLCTQIIYSPITSLQPKSLLIN